MSTLAESPLEWDDQGMAGGEDVTEDEIEEEVVLVVLSDSKES